MADLCQSHVFFTERGNVISVDYFTKLFFYQKKLVGNLVDRIALFCNKLNRLTFMSSTDEEREKREFWKTCEEVIRST